MTRNGKFKNFYLDNGFGDEPCIFYNRDEWIAFHPEEGFMVLDGNLDKDVVELEVIKEYAKNLKNVTRDFDVFEKDFYKWFDSL